MSSRDVQDGPRRVWEIVVVALKEVSKELGIAILDREEWTVVAGTESTQE